MQRDEKITAGRPDPIREAVGLPVGLEGGYYIGVGDQDGDPWNRLVNAENGIVNANHEPKGQPGLWCQWVPNEAGTAIKWDDDEKFYEYTAWIKYLITHFLEPWGYRLNGKVKWKGEERGDRGYILIWNNHVYVNEEPSILEKIVDATATQEKKS
jgi:hypothetical protein